MELKFVAVARPKAPNAVVQRRNRLIRRIDYQVTLIEHAKVGMLPRASWAWNDETGNVFLSIKYGQHLIEMQKGKSAIQCSNLEDVRNALQEVRKMVMNGDLDLQLEEVSQLVRRRFASK